MTDHKSSKSPAARKTSPQRPPRRPLAKRLFSIAWQVAVVVVIVLLLRAWMARDLVAGPAPDLPLTTLDGETVTLASFADEPMMLHFWATWCPICRFEDGEIQRVSRSHPVLTVAMQSGTEAEVARHLDEQDSDLTVINDPDADLARVFGVRAVPSTFLLDAEGNIRYRKQGYAPPFEMRLRLWWLRVFG